MCSKAIGTKLTNLRIKLLEALENIAAGNNLSDVQTNLGDLHLISGTRRLIDSVNRLIYGIIRICYERHQSVINGINRVINCHGPGLAATN